MRRRLTRRAVAAGAAILAAAACAALAAPRPAPDSAPTPAVRLDVPPARAAGGPGGLAGGETAALHEGAQLVLEVRARAHDTYVSLAEKYLADVRDLAALRGRDKDGPVVPGAIVAIPYAVLNDSYKLAVIRALFPRDGPRDGDWVHHSGGGAVPAAQESLWHLALWLTGRGENFEAIADRNGLVDLQPRGGQEIVVPGTLLVPPFAPLAGAGDEPGAAPAPAEAAPEESADDFTEAAESEPETGPEPPPLLPGPRPPRPIAEGADELTYGADGAGRYAVYRLKRGEALYSAVVLRFTGRVDAQEVNELARAIAGRSGVADVTDMPIGFKVRIPLDHLLPEYLPPEDPRRAAWEKRQAEVERYTNLTSTRNLKGVAVILDAGHGGQDRGAAHNGVWEHDYVYDILCRIKARLERDTGARVLTTIKDRREGFTVHDATRLTRSQAEVLLTDPPFVLRAGTASVNLRWYLSNSFFRRVVSEGIDPLKVVFASLHADARHPSLKGAMVYVPGAEYRRGRHGYAGAVYTRHREVREKRYVSFTRQERERSEGLSRQFAARLIRSFRDHGVNVHPYLPVRERIIRRGRSWVPAVLRCSEVPVQVLVEVSNLSNPADSKVLAEPAYRQRVADAFVDTLQRYYGAPAANAPPRTRAARH